MQSNDRFSGGEEFDEDDQDFEEIVKGDADFGWENEAAANRKRQTLSIAPEAPKIFKSAYICYVMHKMDEMKQRLEPEIKVTLIMKKLAKMWKALPAMEKREFEAIADADKSRYFRELATYSRPIQAVPNKRRKKNPCAPKRAMSAFLSYSQEMRPRVRDEMPGMKNSDVSVVLAQRWRDASDAEKRPHQERERWDRQKYYQDLAVWKSAEEERVKEEDQERKRVSARDTIDFMDLPSSLLVWGDSSSGQGSGQDSSSGDSSPHFSRHSDSHHSSEGPTMQCNVDKNDGNNKRPRPISLSLSTEQWTSMLGTGNSAMPMTSGRRRGSKSSSCGSGSENGHNQARDSHSHGHRDLPLLGVSSISIHGSTASGRDSRSNAGSEDAQHDEENDREGTDLGHSPGRTSPGGEGGSECGSGGGSEGATDSSSGLSDRVHRGLSAFVSFVDGSSDRADVSAGGGDQRQSETVDAAKMSRKASKSSQVNDGSNEDHNHSQGRSSPCSFTSQCPPQALPRRQQQQQQLQYQNHQHPQQQYCPAQLQDHLQQQYRHPQAQVQQQHKDQQFQQQHFLNVPRTADRGYPFGSNTYGYKDVSHTLFACSSMYNNVPSVGLNIPPYAQQPSTIATQAQQLAPPQPVPNNNIASNNGNGVGDGAGSSKARWDSASATVYQHAAGGDSGSAGTSVLTTGENSSLGSRNNNAPR